MDNDVEVWVPPEDLRVAMEAAFFERFLPAQGCVAVGKVLSGDVSFVDEARLWVEAQEGLWDRVAVVLAGLHEVEPVNLAEGKTPSWIWQDWAVALRSPWSRDLEAAIASAEKWLEGRAVAS